jgi:hypothetical protein
MARLDIKARNSIINNKKTSKFLVGISVTLVILNLIIISKLYGII